MAIRTSSLFRAYTANFDRRLVSHRLDQVAHWLAFRCLQSTEHGFSTLAKPIPQHFNVPDVPLALVCNNLVEYTHRCSVACLVPRPLRFSEACRATALCC